MFGGTGSIGPASTAMQTQALSNWALSACADQSARQRNMGLSKIALPKSFGQLFDKGRLRERPLSNKR